MPVLERVNRHVFDLVHRNNLVYNTCWEDPRLDRAALDLTRSSVEEQRAIYRGKLRDRCRHARL